jgi:hypothetical protein
MYRYFILFLLFSSSLKAQYVQWAQASYDGVRNTLIYDQALDSSSNQYYLQAQQGCMGCPNRYFLLKVSKQTLPRWSFPLSAVTGEEIVPRKIATDIAGNVFVIGVYNSNTFTVDASHILTSSTTNTPFLLKLNQYGTVKWAINIEFEALDLAVDKIGRIFLTGDGFTSAYTTAGNFIWTNSDYYGHSIATGFTNKIVIADDTRIIRLNANGHLQWVNNSLGGGKVDVDSLGRAFVLNGNGMNRISTAGVVSWTKSNISGTDFDVDAVGNIYIANASGVSKYSQTGSLRWSKAVGSVTGVRCNANDEAFLIGAFDNSGQYFIPPFALDPNTYPMGYFGATSPFRAKIVGSGHPAQLQINFNYNDPFYFMNAVSHTFCQGNPLLKNGIDLYSGLNIFYQVMINSAGDFDSGNQFTYQISSDAAFTSPIVLPGGIIPLSVTPGNYFVRAISSSPVKVSNSLRIIVGNNPLPIITANGPTSFCAGGSVALSVSYPDPQYFDYEWHKDGNFFDFGLTVNVTDPGDYTVIPFSPDNAGCDVKLWSLPTQVLTPCRVGDADLKHVVYPNPSSADFTIGFSNADIQRSISIFDLNGQLIESLPATERQLSFGENLIPGVYMVEIVGQQKIAPIKIVKIK